MKLKTKDIGAELKLLCVGILVFSSGNKKNIP